METGARRRYERLAAEAWFRKSDKSPMTGEPLPTKMLIPNHALRSLIVSFKEDS